MLDQQGKTAESNEMREQEEQARKGKARNLGGPSLRAGGEGGGSQGNGIGKFSCISEFPANRAALLEFLARGAGRKGVGRGRRGGGHVERGKGHR